MTMASRWMAKVGSALVCGCMLALAPVVTCSGQSRLWNVDFAAYNNVEVGIAATGLTTNDFWNNYTAPWQPFGALSNLLLADGTPTMVGLTVQNGGGHWAFSYPDLMYSTYLYARDPGDTTVTLTNLPAGQYDFYLYGHAAANDANTVFEVIVGGTSYGRLSTAINSDWSLPHWVEGAQFVVFRQVSVGSGGVVTILAHPGRSGATQVNGLQILNSAPAAPTIVRQPASQTVTVGAGAALSVLAVGSPPLSYQWSFNGAILPAATASTLTLTNVQSADAGAYAVTVANPLGSIQSSNAILAVTAALPRVLWNVDFAAYNNVEVGTAATGLGANDFWNNYTAPWQSFGALANLLTVDGTATTVGLTVQNGGGHWAFSCSDLMYGTYLYGINPGDTTVTVTNLPAGQYDFYLYGHAAANDANTVFEVIVGGTSYGRLSTATDASWSLAHWIEGAQYVVYRQVSVGQGGSVTILAHPGLSGYTQVNGLQIRKSGPAVPTIVQQPASQTVTVGDTVALSVLAGGSPPLAYQWSLNGASLAGATASTLALTNVQTSDAGAYAVTVTNAVGSIQSSNATLTVSAAPAIIQQPASQTVTAGASATFWVLAGGSPPLAYQWSWNGAPVAGATTSALTIAQAQSTDVGTYAVTVTNAFGGIQSGSATLTVTTVSPGVLWNVDFAAYNHVEVGPAATGLTTNDYWNNYTAPWQPFGALGNLVSADGSATTVGLTVQNGGGHWAFSYPDLMYSTYLYAIDPGDTIVTITNLPGGQYDFYLYGHAAANNANTVFEVEVGATSYGLLSTATNSDWSLTYWVEGAQYVVYRQVSVAEGVPVKILAHPGLSGYTQVNGLQIRKSGVMAPEIVRQPAGQTVAAGANATLWVLAAGSPPLAYQWSLNGVDLSGATASALCLTNVQATDAGAYAVTVSNPVGGVQSSNALIAVTTSLPQVIWNVDFAAYNQVEVGPAATGLGPSDVWNNYTAPWQSFGALANLTTADGTVTTVGLTVQNGGGHWSFSSPDLMYGTYLYGINPGDTTVTVTNLTAGLYDLYLYGHAAANDANTVFEVVVGAASYGRLSTATNSDWNLSHWVEGAQYVVFRQVSVAQGGSATILAHPGLSGYTQVNGLQLRNSAPAAPAIVQPPANQTVTAGANATFWVVAAGSPPLTYQWSLNGAIIPGATTSALTISNALPADAGAYAVTVTNAVGGLQSGNATLVVTTTPVITQQPANQTVSVGANATFRVTAGTPLPVAYQWMLNGVALTGATASALTITNVQPVDAGTYAVTVSDAFGSIQSSNATLTVTTALSQVLWNVDFAAYNNVEVGLAATGLTTNDFWNNYTDPWQSFGAMANLLTAEGTATTVGLTVQNGGGHWAFSCPDLMYGTYLYGINPGDTIVTVTNLSAGQYDFYLYGHAAANNANTVFEVVVGATSYGRLSTATNSDWSLPHWVEGAQYVVYRGVSVTNGGSVVILAHPGLSGYTQVNGLQVRNSTPSAPMIAQQPASQTTDIGGTAVFSVVAGGTAPLTYQWWFGGTPLAGATDRSLTLSNVGPTNAGTYFVAVANAAGSVTSSNAVLVVRYPMASLQVVSVTNAAAGQTVTVPVLLVANGNENALSFSLDFDPATLAFTGAALGSASRSGTLLLNTNRLTAGRLGVLLALPTEAVFAPGPQEVVLLSFAAALLATNTSTALSFGDDPTARQLSDAEGDALPADWSGGTGSLAAVQYEGDVSPRPDGDQAVTVTDWVLVGRYAAGLDYPTNASEFQRADCAPRSTLGDGAITVSDWVQVGRYAAGMDPLTPAGGPTADTTGGGSGSTGSGGGAGPKDLTRRSLTATTTMLVVNQAGTVSLLLDAQGNENALGASLAFDPARLTYTGATLGRGAPAATLNVNASQAAAGKLGFVLALKAGGSFAPGMTELLELTFQVATATPGACAVSFADRPVKREVSDTSALTLASAYANGAVVVNPLPSLSVARSDQGVVLSWPLWATNFVVLATPGGLPSSGVWTSLSVTPITTNGQNAIRVPASSTSRFYRLSAH